MNLAATIALALFTSLLGTSVLAEDLRLVGNIEPVGIKVYVDRDSISRRAHISNVTVIAMPDPTRKNADNMPFSFDCADKLYYLPDGKTTSIDTPMKWEKNGSSYALSVKTIPNIFSVACKSSWEFWK